MCKTNNPRKLDKCMELIIHWLKHIDNKAFKTLACCCGHGIYPMTIVVTDGKIIWDLRSGHVIPRKKRFYKEDELGYYYIPEVMK